MNKIIIGLLAVLALAGCATTANYQQALNRWQGAPAQQLARVWGDPDAEIKLPSGNTVYMYLHERLYTAPVSPAPVFAVSSGAPIYNRGRNNNFVGSQTMRLYCRTWFEANKQGIIINSRFQGNNCIANKL